MVSNHCIFSWIFCSSRTTFLPESVISECLRCGWNTDPQIVELCSCHRVVVSFIFWLWLSLSRLSLSQLFFHLITKSGEIMKHILGLDVPLKYLKPEKNIQRQRDFGRYSKSPLKHHYRNKLVDVNPMARLLEIAKKNSKFSFQELMLC